MSCPYFDEGYFGTCSASKARYVPRIERMETYCFKPTYRLCPILSEYLYENDMAMANRSSKKEVVTS
jgi:hypothetical protein